MEEDNNLVYIFLFLFFIFIVCYLPDILMYKLPSHIPRKFKVYDPTLKKELSIIDLSFNGIPAKIHQIVDSNYISKKMKDTIDNNINSNIEFDYNFYNNNDCRNFIAENFVDQVLYAYDYLPKGPYKNNLAKYCILYSYGGIYLDPHYCIKTKLIEYIQENPLVFVKNVRNTVSTDILIAPPGLDIFRVSIEVIINLVNNNKVTKNNKNQLINSESILYSLITARNYTKYVSLYKNKSGSIFNISDDKKILELYDRTPL